MHELRPALPDDVETLLRIQREAAVYAFAHVYPPEQYPFPDDEIRDLWAEALADPDIEVYVAECDGVPAGSVSVGEEYLRTLYVLRPTRAAVSARRSTTSRSSGFVRAGSGRRSSGRWRKTAREGSSTSGVAGR